MARCYAVTAPFPLGDFDEVTMVATFKVRPGFKGDRIDPPEPASVEDIRIEFLDGKTELAGYEALADRYADNAEFAARLLSEANDQDQSAAEDRADDLRNERMEGSRA